MDLVIPLRASSETVKSLAWRAGLDGGPIDGLWRNIVELPKKAGWAFSFMQRGQLGGYSLLMAVGLVAYLLLLSFGK